MRKLLAKMFIKNYQDYQNPKVRTAYGTLSGAVGVVTNVLLCAAKILTGLFSGSISIIADGINNLADAGSSVITLIGFKMANKPADPEHPFGHERMEYITGLIVSFIILIIGVSLMKTSIEKIITPQEISYSWYIFVILGVSILAKFWQSCFYKGNGKLIDSTALIATSKDSLNDSISTLAVLISLVISYFAHINLDGYMGIIVSVFILVSGIKMVKETISPLLGEAPNKEEVDKVVSAIKSYDGVLGIHDLVFHSYGPGKTFITAHVEVDASVNILVSHDMIDNIESDFRARNVNLVIHMDPIDTTDEVTVKLHKVIEEILFNIDPVLHFHDFRTVQGPTHTNVIFDVVLPCNYKYLPNEVKGLIDEALALYDPTLNTVIIFDYNYLG